MSQTSTLTRLAASATKSLGTVASHGVPGPPKGAQGVGGAGGGGGGEHSSDEVENAQFRYVPEPRWFLPLTISHWLFLYLGAFASLIFLFRMVMITRTYFQ